MTEQAKVREMLKVCSSVRALGGKKHEKQEVKKDKYVQMENWNGEKALRGGEHQALVTNGD